MQRQAQAAMTEEPRHLYLGHGAGQGFDFRDAIKLAQLREQVRATAKRKRTAFLEPG